MVKPLMDLSRIPNDPVAGVLYAASLLPHKQMFDLGAVYDGNGGVDKRFPYSSEQLTAFKPGAPSLSADGLTNPGIQKAWFYVANGQWDVLKQVAGMTKRSGEVGEQATLLLTRSADLLRGQHATWKGLTLDMVAYEQGLALVERLSAHPSLKDEAKSVEAVLKEAEKGHLKDQVIARSAYRKVAPMAVSMRKNERDQGIAGLSQIVDRFGGTVYGGEAKGMLETQ